MIIFPAVDIKGGKCVRLRKGQADKATVFFENPLDAALHWQSLGAKWLHVIDLDGAFEGKPVNVSLIAAMKEALNIPIQLGGGIRSIETAKAYLDAGVTRLIIGTMALEQPDLYGELASTFPGKVGVSLDTDKGELKTKGWVGSTGQKIQDVLLRLHEQGTAFLIHTDISRDGTQSGINIDLISDLASISSIPVIAAGGVATLDDIKNLSELSKTSNLEGAITGQAIYDGSLDFKEAIQWLEQKRT